MKISMTVIKKYVSCAFAGVVNGMMGTGGGTVIYIANDEGVEGQKQLQGFMIAIVGVFSATGAVDSIGKIDDPSIYLTTLFGSVAGCIVGSYLISSISGRALRVVFSVLLIISGIKMLF